MSSFLAVGSNTVLLQLGMMKFHDRRENAKAHRNGKRRPQFHMKRAGLDAVVLHAMSFNRGNSLTAYDGVNAHFAVLRSGDILYLHDVHEYLYASHDFNDRGIAIEFAGNPPSSSGWVYKPEKFGMHIPTREQMDAGRRLVSLLTKTFNLRYIYGHRQSARKLCPGPHIWHNVGLWGKNVLGLSDGGEGFWTSNKYARGVPIPEEWSDPRFSVYNPTPVEQYVAATVGARMPIP